MGRPKGQGRGLTMVGFTIEPEGYAALRQFADENDLSMSEAVRHLLKDELIRRGNLRRLSPRELVDQGYNDGLRRGLHAARQAIHDAVQGLWR